MRSGSLRALLLRIRDHASRIRDHVTHDNLPRDPVTQPVLHPATILKYSREMMAGLTYLHENNIIHRDLRAANVLISSANTAKLSDFGLSKKLEQVARIPGDYTPDLGNPFWRSPESIMNDDCGPAVDVWSFGITVLEMVYVDPPFMKQETFRYMYALYRHRHVPEIPTFVDSRIREILRKSLQYSPQDRALAAELLDLIEGMMGESLSSDQLNNVSIQNC